MKLSAIVQEAHFIQKTVGVQEAARDFDKMTEAQRKAATAGEVLVKQEEVAEKAITRVGSKLDAYTRQFDPLSKALKDVERGERLIAAARGQGITVSDQTLSALENARAKYQKLSGGLNDNTHEVALNRAGWINLSRQLQDVGVSLYGGQSPMTVLVQQGSQIADVFSSSKGGAGAALGEFGAAVARYALNPVTLLAAAAGAAGVAMMAWREQTDAMTAALNGLGRQAGATGGQLNRIADSAPGLSMSAARGYATQFADAGVAGSDIGGALGLVRPFSSRLGVDQDTAAKTLAGAIAEPTKGAAELAKEFGLLSYAEREQIRSLEAVGNKSGASALLIQTLADKIDAMKDPTTGLSAALEQAKNGFSNFITKLGDQLAGPTSYADSIGKIAQAADAAKQKIADENASILKAVGDQFSSEAATQRARLEQLAAAEKALNDPRAMVMLGSNATAAADAVDRLRNQIAAFKDDASVAAEQGRTNAALIGEDNLSRKAQLQAEQAYRDEMRASGDQALAAARSAAILSESMASMSKAISDANTAARNQLELAGKSPIEQQMIRLEQQSREDAARGAFSQSAFNDRVRATTKQYQYDTFGSPTADLQGQMRLLDVQRADIGKSKYDQAFDSAYMEKYNQLLKDNIEITPEAVELMNRYAQAHADLAVEAEKVNKQEQGFRDALDITRSSLKDLGESLVNAFRRGESAGNAMLGVLDRLTSKLLDKTLDMGLDALMGKSGSTGGGMVGSLLSGVGKIFGFANGGVMTSAGPLPLMSYANGGIADRPQLAMFGEGRHNEAFVPLPDGRAIPVKMQGAQGGGKVTIHNYAGADVQASQNSQGEWIIIMQKMIEANNQKIPGIVANSQRRSM